MRVRENIDYVEREVGKWGSGQKLLSADIFFPDRLRHLLHYYLLF